MKFQFPELKFPNTLLTIWWGAAMMAAGAALMMIFGYRHYLLPATYLIVACIMSYFVAVQTFTIWQAINERKSLETYSLYEKWHKIISSNHGLHLSSIIPVLTLPLLFFSSSHMFPIDRNLMELLFAPGRYAGDGFFEEYYWLYFFCGAFVVYLHIRVLGAWLILIGLLLKPSRIPLVIITLLILALGLNQLTNFVIEAPMEAIVSADWQCQNTFSSTDCNVYWTYRNINRIVETAEYGFYGLLTGGIQYTNLLKFPVTYYNGQQAISWEFLRNFVAGILSPLLQLFFIMRYLKKRSFEKTKREYAA